jgi:hypothetical protein
MLSFYLDYTIFIDFIEKQPKDILKSDKEYHNLWNKLWEFIESGSDLTLFNLPENLNEFEMRCITRLTEGRRNSKIYLDPFFKVPHKFKFNQDSFYQSILFINENNEESKKKYTNNNQFPIAFLDNYFELFKKVTFSNHPIVKSVRNNKGNFHSWLNLKDYLPFVTDVIIADNYLFSDPSLLDVNFYEIVKILYGIRPDLNLTIITYDNPRFSINIEDFKKEIKNKLSQLKLKEKFDIVFLNSELKEHDRGIFTNFTRIKSGDSFNYFNTKGQVITKGTELDFYSLTKPDYFNNTEIALNALCESTNKTRLDKKSLNVANRLFIQK